MNTYYQIMGLDRSCTDVELKIKWRELATKLHPDKHGGTKEANDIFACISLAYAVLSDPHQRHTYNNGLDLLSDKCNLCNGEGRVWKQKGFTNRTSMLCVCCRGSGRISRT